MSDNGQQTFFPVVQKWTKWTIDYTVVHVRTWTTAIYIYKYIVYIWTTWLFCMVGREFETLPSPIPNKNYAVDLKKDNRGRS